MKLSVIIPFYNLERYVRECLDSVFASVGDDAGVEVIAVDDGSTDSTPSLLDEYRPAFDLQTPSLIVIHKPNGGEGSARNAGLAVATGEWITFLDGDDVWLPNMVSEVRSALAAHPDADIIGFRFLPFDDGSRVPESRATVNSLEFNAAEGIPSEAILELGVFPTLFRREKFRGIGFTALPLGADRLYVAQCLAIAGGVVMSDAGVHGYRVRAGSMARAEWNARKVKSMIDFAAGSLAAFSTARRQVARGGSDYLMDVLTSVAAKKTALLREGRDETRSYWLDALARINPSFLSFRHRLRRIWYNIFK